jgi:hypothetical protein
MVADHEGVRDQGAVNRGICFGPNPAARAAKSLGHLCPTLIGGMAVILGSGPVRRGLSRNTPGGIGPPLNPVKSRDDLPKQLPCGGIVPLRACRRERRNRQ